MKQLAQRIDSDLKKLRVCAVYDSDLARVFPKTMPIEKRKERIRRFAARHGLSVDFYDVGLCALFEKPVPSESKKTAGGFKQGRARANK